LGYLRITLNATMVVIYWCNIRGKTWIEKAKKKIKKKRKKIE